MSSDGGYPTPYPGAPRRARRALPSDWEELPATQDFNPPATLIPVQQVPLADPYGIEEYREPTGALRLPASDPESEEPTVALAGYGRRTSSGAVISPPRPVVPPAVALPPVAQQPIARSPVAVQPSVAQQSAVVPPVAYDHHVDAQYVTPIELSGPVSLVPLTPPAPSFMTAPLAETSAPPRPHRSPRQDPRSAAVIADAGEPFLAAWGGLPQEEDSADYQSTVKNGQTRRNESGDIDDHAKSGRYDGASESDSDVEPPKRPRWQSWLLELFVIILGAMVLTSVLRLFVYQTFNVPSGSMEHTIETGDSIIAVKLIDFERGDVVVFEDPGDWLRGAEPDEPTGVRKVLEWVGLLPSTATRHLVKRVIGMPGDHVVCCDAAGRITVNGTALMEDDYLYSTNGVAVAPSAMRFDIIVPKDRIFVMGDHRDQSADSRFHLCEATGGEPPGMAAFVPIDKVTGTVVAVTGPWDHMARIRVPETFNDIPSPGPAPDTPSIVGPCR